MKHCYLILIFCCMFSLTSYESQAQTNTATHLVIQGLSVYPNPVTNGKSSVSITSNTNSIKTVAIYNVLGKKIQAAVATRKTLDISTLSAGVYILEITQGNASETRKLIVR